MDVAIMDKKQQALDIALQHGFLNIHCDNRGYPKKMLKGVDRHTMRCVMNAFRMWFAEHRREYPHSPITGISFRRFYVARAIQAQGWGKFGIRFRRFYVARVIQGQGWGKLSQRNPLALERRRP